MAQIVKRRTFCFPIARRLCPSGMRLMAAVHIIDCQTPAYVLMKLNNFFAVLYCDHIVALN